MQDPYSIQQVTLLHPLFRDQITAFIDEVEATTGLIWRIVQGWRSFAQQTALYAEGRTAPGTIVTYSIAGTSYHNYGLAVDIAPFLAGTRIINWHFDYSKLRALAAKHGLTMGLDFTHPDSDHFENKLGLNWRDMQHMVAVKDFIPGTQFINIKPAA